jgi:hypothetical protein
MIGIINQLFLLCTIFFFYLKKKKKDFSLILKLGKFLENLKSQVAHMKDGKCIRDGFKVQPNKGSKLLVMIFKLLITVCKLYFPCKLLMFYFCVICRFMG